MSVAADLLVYAGPTRYGSSARDTFPALPVRWRPPIRRGDLERLIEEEPPGVLAIVDGVFQQSLSVGHAEIRMAIETGWTVWGLSSMGAIRAYEMRHLGVRGFGRVYDRFFRAEDFRDDEVALLHSPEPPFDSISEPLVHLRVALEDLVTQGVLRSDGARSIAESLEAMWFGDRTLICFRDMLLSSVAPEHVRSVQHYLSSFDKYRIKSHDLSDFLDRHMLERNAGAYGLAGPVPVARPSDGAGLPPAGIAPMSRRDRV